MNVPKIIHYTALILGFQASAFFLFFLIADSCIYLFEGKTNVIPILLMMIFTVGGFVWEIAKPGKGSLPMIAGGVIMAIYLIILGGLSLWNAFYSPRAGFLLYFKNEIKRINNMQDPKRKPGDNCPGLLFF